ncbi:hypothetical protein EV649_6366 [Kribbella sp. VKM Ac-2569]|uniref:hypothetical protein n=1 Tax=Kribbella sp. VKM Ac-2569 TaxID=2512220 RepID=UPI00102ABF44|nr:hypothetical protein [Kribbella sp. VKM Ac-2569]RZT13177.1 hypothetical protein EV649_6366 [Kribbella sp. VKM Ac-2569]
MSEPTFTIYPIPIAAYSPDVRRPFASIPAEDDAKAIADLLTPYGGVVHPWTDGRPDAAWVQQELGAWADRDGPRSSVLVWVGHGESDTEDAWLASYNSTQHMKGSGHHAEELATHLADEWAGRSDDPGAWTLVVIEACGAERFVQLLAAKILSTTNPAKRFALLGGGGTGSGFLEAVPKALDLVLKSFTANDEVIRVADLVGRLEDQLAFGFAIPIGLGQARPLTPPARPLGAGVTATQDVYLELEAFLAGLPKDQRKFFVPKAQGAELGEPTWYFEGRSREHREITEWLRTTSSGLLAVTGPAGSGKSAVLGNLVVHSNPSLRELLIRTDRVKRLAAPEQPPDDVFNATVLLTGLTTTEVINRLAADLEGEPDVSTTLEGLRTVVEGSTVMVDALDEAQDPPAVAAVLRQLSEVPGCRVVVGTRRSTNEGLDRLEPVDTNLLDALEPIATVTVDLDPEAVTRYVEHRLSALPIDPGTAAAAARSVGAHNRHFLYARLAVHEILARPELLTADAQPELAELLQQDNRGLFATAVDRLTVANRNFRPLLEALGHARGRGLPRADGTWATAAGAFTDGRPGEADLDNLLVAAAPYVMLDGEHGQSTYRLAHQTFVEHFHAQPSYAAGHRRIARALATRQRAALDGWADANFYAVRYLAEHLVADADRIAPASAAVVDLVTDAGWLTRAVDLLGVDQTDAVITAAKLVMEQDASRNDVDATVRWMTTFQPVDVVERTLRRSRTTLTRDPTQLPGQLHARLKEYPGASMTGLGDAVGRLSTTPWLRMVEGSLDWRADLESTYGTTGKVRGLGFGHVDDLPVVAIAVDTRIELWDPRTGVPDPLSMIVLDHRATAVAMAVINGRSVVVTSAGYDRIVEVWDARTKERIAAADVGLGHAIGVGRVDGRQVIAGVDFGRSLKMVDAVTLRSFDLPPALEALDVRGFGIEDDGALVLLAVQDEPPPDRAHRILLINPVDGREGWRTDPIQFDSGSDLDVMAGAPIGAPFVVAAGIGRSLFWFTEGHAHVEKSPYDERARAIAIGVVGGHPIVAAAPDLDGTALVQLQQLEYVANRDGVTLSRLGSASTGQWRYDRFMPTKVPEELGNEPSRTAFRPRPLDPDRPEGWPQSVAAAGELDGVPVIATGSVDGAVWVWDRRTLSPASREGERPRAIAGPFVELPSYVLEQGWDLLYVKPNLEQATSVALGNVPGYGAIVAVACGGRARVYTITDGKRIENPADRASAVQCVAIGSLNTRTVLVTGSTGGNVAVWDPAAGTRIAGLYVDDPITHLAVDSGRILLRTATHGDYALELKEP